MFNLCDKIWDALSAETNTWEIEASNLDELLSGENDQTWEIIQRASAIAGSDPAAAFQLYLEAAEAGSVWSMGMVGWHYWTGIVVNTDSQIALDYYHRAVCGGSWMDTIYYARILAELGHSDHCERVLEDGVKLDFIPAYYWLAWFRYERSKTSVTRREVRPLLEYAAGKGHPGANDLLAHWMVRGKLRLRDVPRGWRLVFQAAVRSASRENTASAS